jgi:type IV pilus assembly protein PilY1
LEDSVAYIRGKNGIAGTRQRGGATAGDNVLGDIIHSAPVLMRPTAANGSGAIFVGAGDGMLHAFDAETGAERFAFIPSLVHDHLVDLSRSDYLDNHRYYADASPVVEHLAFFDSNGVRTQDMRLLVSGLGRGGKGYFALDVSNADAVGSAGDTAAMLKWEYPSRSMSVTGLDANGDGRVESNTPAVGNPALYTYQYESNGGDGRDRDGNKQSLYIYDSGGARIGLAYRDDDLGYSYSAPVIIRSYLSANKAMPTGDNDHPWVVIFGNGYDSYNGKAVLYVLDALTGTLIRKIDTGAGGEADRPKNGLSSPAVVDVDDDDRADFAYAGDLRGNLWKFDLRAADPSAWRVVHENASGQPQPLFTTAPRPGETGQPITTMPQVLRHNKKPGYVVVFGTGKFLNEIDRIDHSAQTLFGVWDSDSAPKDAPLDQRKYLGVWNRDANSFSNQTAGNLLKQEVSLQQTMPMNNSDIGETDATIRLTSSNSRAASGWWSADNLGGYMGWYLDLPGRSDIGVVGGAAALNPAMFNTDAAERIVKDPLIRDGKVIAVSFIPSGAPCGAGGYSFLMELSAFTGDRPNTVQLDINGDSKLTADDLISFAGGKYAVSGYGMSGMANTPVFTGGSGESGERGETETKILPGSSGIMNTLTEQASELGIYYWREMTNN